MTPTTKAGRALLEWASRAMPEAQQRIWIDHITAIEREAAQRGRIDRLEGALTDATNELRLVVKWDADRRSPAMPRWLRVRLHSALLRAILAEPGDE